MAISKITGSALGKDVIMKDVATADGSSPTLTLQTGDTDIAADDVLGTINFQAPDEGAGTEAILVASGISVGPSITLTLYLPKPNFLIKSGK